MASTQYLRIAFAPGVVPGKWFSRFDGRVNGWQAAGAQSDDPLAHILSGGADIGIVRLPGALWDGGVGSGALAEISDIEEPEMNRLGLYRVRLYQEQPGVAVPRDHLFKALGDNEPATMEDLEGEKILYRGVDPAQVRAHLDVVAANVGGVVAPRPLLRSINKRGVIHRLLEGAPESNIALVWRQDRDDEVVQQFIGVCRGRRPGSSR